MTERAAADVGQAHHQASTTALSPLTDAPPAGLKNCGEVRVQHIDDGIDGSLTIAEVGKSVPFPVNRVYFITRLGNPDAERGQHAHRVLEQLIFCINGSFELEVDDGERRARVVLDEPDRGIYLGPGLWHTMRRFSPECVILVLASALYEETDYIRDYDTFRALVTAHNANTQRADGHPERHPTS